MHVLEMFVDPGMKKGAGQDADWRAGQVEILELI